MAKRAMVVLVVLGLALCGWTLDRRSQALQTLAGHGRVDHVLWSERDLPTFIRGDFDYAAKGSPEQIALAFLAEQREVFRLQDIQAELVLKESDVDEQGNTHLHFDQRHQGLPVFQGELKVHVNKLGHVTAANGLYVDGIAVDTKPFIPAVTAKEMMIAHMGFAEVDSLARTPGLAILRQEGKDHLAWRGQVYAKDAPEGWDYFVDAHDARVLCRFSLVVE